MLFKFLKGKKDADSSNFDIGSDEKVNYKVKSFGENTSIQNFRLEMIESTSCLKNNNNNSGNFQVFEEKIDKKAGSDSNFLVRSDMFELNILLIFDVDTFRKETRRFSSNS